MSGLATRLRGRAPPLLALALLLGGACQVAPRTMLRVRNLSDGPVEVRTLAGASTLGPGVDAEYEPSGSQAYILVSGKSIGIFRPAPVYGDSEADVVLIEQTADGPAARLVPSQRRLELERLRANPPTKAPQ